MKVTTFALITLAGMAGTTALVWGSTGRPQPVPQVARPAPPPPPVIAPQTPDRHTFQAGGTLMMEGRLGHAVLPAASPAETFLFVDVSADAAQQATTPAPLDLAIVIDRSGSMKGKRMMNAKAGARAAVDRLRDGDTVSVIAFADMADVVVPPTVITSFSRTQVMTQIERISARGETCISCGLDTGLSLLRSSSGQVTQMLLLSDGDATRGIRDLGGLARLADVSRGAGVAVTTIGVDLEYNERIMSTLARGSNGRHYFVDRPEQLAEVFRQETEALMQTLARNVELEVDVAPGVVVDHVFDRVAEQRGDRLVVPMGGFARGDRKSLLVRLRVPAGQAGDRPVASVRMRYDDLVQGGPGACEGELVARASTNPAELSPLDALVAGRLGRSETAAVLETANDMAHSGRLAEASQLLRTQKDKNAASRAAAGPMAGGKADRAFMEADAALDAAGGGFAPPTASAPGAPRPVVDHQARANEKKAFDLAQ